MAAVALRGRPEVKVITDRHLEVPVNCDDWQAAGCCCAMVFGSVVTLQGGACQVKHLVKHLLVKDHRFEGAGCVKAVLCTIITHREDGTQLGIASQIYLSGGKSLPGITGAILKLLLMQLCSDADS